MKSLDVIGYKRQLVKNEAKKLRQEGQVPCVLYGQGETVHFYTPMILFREMVYTPDVHQVNLDIEGEERQAILHDIQFHPVSDNIEHADFYEVNPNDEVTVEVPVKTTGRAPGVQEGGILFVKNRRLKVRALPKDIPNALQADVSELNLGDTIKVEELKTGNFDILDNPEVTVIQIVIPRGVKVTAAGTLEETELEPETHEGGEESEEGASESGEGGEEGSGEGEESGGEEGESGEGGEEENKE